MKRSKRPRMKKNREREYYQIPKDREKEIQQSCEFVNKLKESGDKKVFIKFLEAMRCYQLKSLTYIDLKTKVFFILRDHDVLLQDFKQLLLELATEKEEKMSQNPKKSDVERTVEFFNKLEGLGNGIHGAILHQLAFADDIPILVSQVDLILRDHASLKQEFRTFLIDSGLLKYVTPSYMLRHETEEVSSPSSSVLNGTYVSVGHEFGSNKVARRRTFEEVRMNELEDELFNKNIYLKALKSVIKFGKKSKNYDKKPPVGFNRVVRRFYEDRGKKVPENFKREPKLAIQSIRPVLKIMKKVMSRAKKLKARKIYQNQQ